MSWRMADALGGSPTAGLLGEINARAPERSKDSDGGIGDKRHAGRQSDHNACPCCAVVCGRDFTHDPPHFDSYAFAEWLRGRVVAEPPELRVKYVISNGRIFSGQGQAHPAGKWRPYRGKNAHRHHVHVSVRHGPEFYDSTAPWGWQEGGTA
jgi:hypothetical protein